MKNISYGIIGASGHTAQELIHLLATDTRLQCVFLQSSSQDGILCEELSMMYENISDHEMIQRKPDVIFFATPHGICMHQAKIFLDAGIKIIDLSGDFRFFNTNDFETAYCIPHSAKDIIRTYGLPEIFSSSIQIASLVANPGCYVTATLLALFPLQDYIQSVIIDGKSGFSGAGKHFSQHQEIMENGVIPYTITKHRHEAEMQQFFSFPLGFTPHLISIYRGMSVTLHITLTEHIDAFALVSWFYKNSPLVHVQKEIPLITSVQNTNKCILGGFQIDTKTNRLVIVSVLDNLRKGASAQAVQNMYTMFSLPLPSSFL